VSWRTTFIIKVDNDQVQGLTLNQAVEKLRGAVNTKIKLTITRKGSDKPIGVSIIRDVIRVKSVRSHIEGDDIGYIRITQFDEQTTNGLKKALSDLTGQLGADKIKGFVIDLRNNPGGLLDQAIRLRMRFWIGGKLFPPAAATLVIWSALTPAWRPDQRQAGDRAD
jgi:carboxyl-terminal processing protease